MKKCLIISGGEFEALSEFVRPVDITQYDLIIACDRGVLYASKMGIRPDLIIGDFDSLNCDPADIFPGVNIKRYPVMKDDTDTMLAIKHALSKDYKDITLVCALGGRCDHFIANIESLHYIALNGGKGHILSKNESLMTLTEDEKKLSLKGREGFCFSLFSLTDHCDGLTIKDALYNAENITLKSSFPLGHGNHFTDKPALISIKSGILLIVESHTES